MDEQIRMALARYKLNKALGRTPKLRAVPQRGPDDTCPPEYNKLDGEPAIYDVGTRGPREPKRIEP